MAEVTGVRSWRKIEDGRKQWYSQEDGAVGGKRVGVSEGGMKEGRLDREEIVVGGKSVGGTRERRLEPT